MSESNNVNYNEYSKDELVDELNSTDEILRIVDNQRIKFKQQLTQKDAEIGKLRRVINRVHKDVSNGEHIDGSWIKETFQEVQRDWIFETQNRNHKQQLTKKDAEIESLRELLSRIQSFHSVSGGRQLYYRDLDGELYELDLTEMRSLLNKGGSDE